jgi:hypothetical protein
MANGFVVTKEDWEHMTPAQQGWLTFNAVQELDKRVRVLEDRPFVDKCFAAAGGIIGGAMAYLGLKMGG